MVAFVASLIITLLFVLGFYAYAARRPVDLEPTWGEAMVWATYIFFFLFWIYGVVPHQWLTWADNELNWRPDRLFFGWGDFLKPQAQGGWVPLTITYLVIRDIIAVGIYIALLGVNMKMFVDWQKRGDKQKQAELVPASSYGRPLVKEGPKA